MSYNFDENIDRRSTNSLKYDLLDSIFGSDDILPMWVADMDFKTPDFIIDSIKKRLNHEIFGYTIKSDNFYNSIINWTKNQYNWDIKREWILFSPGVVPSLVFSVLAFSNPGDKILIQPPVYFPFMHVIKANKREIFFNPLKNTNNYYTIDFENLEKNIDEKVKMIFLCNPHNPVGRAWKKDELERLGDICVKNNIVIISDEIHADIVYKPNFHIPIANLNSNFANSTVTLLAPGKTFNIAGLSSSVIIASNKELYKKLESIINSMHIGMGNVFGLVAFESAYTNGKEWLDELLLYLQGSVMFVDEYINKYIPYIEFKIPEATYLLWLNCKDLNLNNNQLKDFFIKKAKVGFNDGPTFGPGGEGFQRMNIGCPKSLIKKALDKISEISIK